MFYEVKFKKLQSTTVSNGNALELESATGRMYPAPTHSDDSAQVSARPVVAPYGVYRGAANSSINIDLT